jgi:hypothetical protein
MTAHMRPQPHHARHSKLRDEAFDPEDGRVGIWTRERLVQTDERFCVAMRKALADTQQSPRRPSAFAGNTSRAADLLLPNR